MSLDDIIVNSGLILRGDVDELKKVMCKIQGVLDEHNVQVVYQTTSASKLYVREGF